MKKGTSANTNPPAKAPVAQPAKGGKPPAQNKPFNADDYTTLVLPR